MDSILMELASQGPALSLLAVAVYRIDSALTGLLAAYNSYARENAAQHATMISLLRRETDEGE
jgi:hypothetical protein